MSWHCKEVLCFSRVSPQHPQQNHLAYLVKCRLPGPNSDLPPQGVTVFEDHPRICIFSRLIEGFLDTLIRRSFQRVESSIALSHWFLVDVVQALSELVNLSITWELVKGGLHSPVVGPLSPSTPRVRGPGPPQLVKSILRNGPL